MNITLENIKSRIIDGTQGISENIAERIARRLIRCSDALEVNIAEWLESKEFTDVWIRDKYCLNAVLKIRGNPKTPLDIADAILALNAYAENTANEHLIWQKRM